MKGIKFNVTQELQMKYDQILGTSYGLVNVVTEIENNINETKDCKHNASNLINIGNKKYCTICQNWTLDNKTS